MRLQGTVKSLHAILEVTLHAPENRRFLLDFIVDTGYTGDLLLPREDILKLQLPYLFVQPSTLADGQHLMIPVYEGNTVWLGNSPLFTY